MGDTHSGLESAQREQQGCCGLQVHREHVSAVYSTSVKKRCCGRENRMLDMLTPCSEDTRVYRDTIKHAAKQPFRISYGEQNQTKQQGEKKKRKETTKK